MDYDDSQYVFRVTAHKGKDGGIVGYLSVDKMTYEFNSMEKARSILEHLVSVGVITKEGVQPAMEMIEYAGTKTPIEILTGKKFFCYPDFIPIADEDFTPHLILSQETH